MGTVGVLRGRCAVVACAAVLAAAAAAGCTSSIATPATIFITPRPAPGTPGPTPVVGGVVISSNAPDGRWTVTFKKPVIAGISKAVADKINDAVTETVNGYISAFTGSGLPAVKSGGAASTLDGDFSIALDSPTIISLRFSLITTVSGKSAVGKPASLNFVAPSGEKIALADILKDPKSALPTLSSEAHAVLAASLGKSLTWAGPATSMSFFEEAWTMTQSGLEFTWAQGEIAGGGAGMPSAILAWSSIGSIVNPDSPAGEFVG